MIKIVYRYLNQTYILSKNDKGEFCIYVPSLEQLEYVYCDDLISNLKLIFSLPESQIKKIVNSWAKRKAKRVNLRFYWNNTKLFPNITRVIGSLISNDIIPVVPMAAPSAQLFYLEPQHRSGDDIVQII